MKKKKQIKKLADLIGKGIDIQENKKTEKLKEKNFFFDIITELCQMEAKSQIISSSGINVMEYEEGYLKVINALLKKYFGEAKAQIIMWWVFESINPEGEVSALVDENKKEHILNTPEELYKFLKRYDEK
tara:strand:- start:32 stop:421 length:390 start_codon:yes stop_codon:yes gene_type:complete